jgi:DNA (cytosine-5)-methyltransferase 1
MRPWPGYEDLKRGLTKAGYNLREQILDASDFGVPQSRRRLFLLADREAQPEQVAIPRRSQKTVRDILDPTGLWPTTPLHKKGRAHPTLMRARRAMNVLGLKASFLIVYYGTDGSGGWQRLDRPLRTITTLDRFALVQRTPNGPRMRMLQIPELKRAMGFDKYYQLPFGTRRERIKLLGNGVCPPVMAAVVSTLIKGQLVKAFDRAA